LNSKILIILLFTSLIASYVPYPTVSASENYKVLLFDETVTVLDSRTVQVSLNYKFMPLLMEGYYYSTWYMYIHTADAYGITVENEYGPLPFNASVEGNWTLLVIDLRRQVYANQSYLLKIGYLATDRIESKGPERNLRMWTVSDSVYKENVTLTVNLPKGFGVVKYEPLFLSSKEGANGTVLCGQMLGVDAGTGYYLSVEFADTVVRYDVTYKYTFVNEGSATEDTPEFEVPAPLNTQRQEITQISYTPTPISTSYDESGNLRAKFRTPSIVAGGSATITIHCVTKITLSPAIGDSFSGGLSDIPSEYMKYTLADEYWEVNDATIRSLSQNLTKGENSALNKVKAIYDYVVDNIEYDDAKFQAILSGQNPGRYGAVKTLTLGRGVCEDISDLFVALCRASGIPAVVVSGPTYSRDGLTSGAEVGHAWTEVYIPGYGWLEIDPTWKLFGRLEGRHIAKLLEKESSEPKDVWWWVYQPFRYELEYDFRLLTGEIIFRPDLSISANYNAETPVGSTLSFGLALDNHGNGTAYTTNVTVIAPDNLRLLNISSYSFDRVRGYESKYLNLVFNATSLGNASIGVIVKYRMEGGEVETRMSNYSLVVTKALTTLSCSVSSYEITEGNAIRVTGSISPALPGKNVTLIFTRPDGRSYVRSATTGSDGSYSDLYQPDTNGSWSVRASWEGDQEHQGASSLPVSFNVIAPLNISASDTTNPVISSITPADGSTLNSTTLTIIASYYDDVAINTTSVDLKVDGVSVTPTALSATKAEYSATFTEGTHSVSLTIKDTSGNTATATWSFTVRISSSQQGSRCLIATATYGSELAPQVQFLRDFRDNLAMRTFAGSSFMTIFQAWYYSWSPPVAASIVPDPTVKAIMRVILQPLLEILQLSTAAFSLLSFNSEFAIVVAGLVASALIGIVYFVPATTAILIATTRLRRLWSVSKPDRLKILVIPWVASVALMLLGELIAVPLLMMFATSAFVILTIANVAGMISLKIASLFERRRNLRMTAP